MKSNKVPMSAEGAVSTGSTLLNLACTENPNLGFSKGGYYYLVGDSTSGKTWLSMTCFAEACLNKHFKNYRLIFDDVENGSLMDIEQYFGKEVMKRIEPPARDKNQDVFSDTVESFYYHMADAIKAKKPFIYVLDSQDALVSTSSLRKFAEQKKASETDREQVGSFGDGKAKYHSEHIRHVIAGLRDTGSILIIIGQTRDNLGMGFEKKTRSGGKALRFYAHIEIWTAVAHKLKKRVNGTDRTLGVVAVAEVRKNRITGKVGKDRAVEIPILNGLGIDDIGACVDFLIKEEHWKETEESTDRKRIYLAPELLVEGSRDALIKCIEEEDMEQRVREITAKVWTDIEDKLLPTDRKKRYA